jgi:hypothetical protein
MRFSDPLTDTPEGRILLIVKAIENAVVKNSECSTCKGDTSGKACKDCYKSARGGYKSDRGQKPPESKDMSEKKKSDATSEFLHERGIIVKYEQEASGDNAVPEFMEVSGSAQIRATGYSTNQRLPYMEDGPKKSIVSETYPLHAFAQTGYDEKSSTLHQHLTDGGSSKNEYRAPVEESMTELRKNADPTQYGIISEIAGLIEKVYVCL